MAIKNKATHLIVNWNSSEDFCLDTIHEHSKIIENNVEKFVWYGKMVKSSAVKNENKIESKIILKLIDQIKNKIPTYLFLYAPNDHFGRRLHVGLVKEITTEYPSEKHLIPPHYNRVPYSCSYWFKISDFKQLSYEWAQHLILQDGQTFDPVSNNKYPVIVTLRNNIDIFDYNKTNGRKWYAFQQLHTQTPTVNRENNYVFVIMPFKAEFNDVYKLGIKNTLEKLNIKCNRADDFYESKAIFKDIIDHINNADLIVADITSNNPNVFYELGFAHAINKKVIIITQDRDDSPFDVYGIRNIEYKANNLTKLASDLEMMIKANMNK